MLDPPYRQYEPNRRPRGWIHQPKQMRPISILHTPLEIVQHGQRWIGRIGYHALSTFLGVEFKPMEP